jgi:hypothetical protein
MSFFQAIVMGFAFALGATLVQPVLSLLRRLVGG